jgi:hypothetical protein
MDNVTFKDCDIIKREKGAYEDKQQDQETSGRNTRHSNNNNNNQNYNTNNYRNNSDVLMRTIRYHIIRLKLDYTHDVIQPILFLIIKTTALMKFMLLKVKIILTLQHLCLPKHKYKSYLQIKNRIYYSASWTDTGATGTYVSESALKKLIMLLNLLMFMTVVVTHLLQQQKWLPLISNFRIFVTARQLH